MGCRRSSKSSSSLFKVDSLLEAKLRRMRFNNNDATRENEGQDLTISLGSFCDKKRDRNGIGERVSVDVLLVREVHERRKSSSNSSALSVIKTISKKDVLTVNSGSEETSSNVLISFNSDLFSSDDTASKQCSYAVVFCVRRGPNNHTNATSTGSVLSPSSGQSSVEIEPKRRKLLRGSSSCLNDNKILTGDLVVFDKKNRCQLTKGEYELSMSENECNSNEATISNANENLINWMKRGVAHWENFTPNVEPLEAFEASPTLKFKVWWRNRRIENDNCLSSRVMNSDKNEKETSTGHNAWNGVGSNSNNRGRMNATRSSCKDNGRVNKNNATTLESKNNITISNGSNKERGTLKLVYQFLFNNDCRQQTEATLDFHCPWCSLNCMHLYALLKHLKLSHPRFLFTYVPIAEGARIDVSVSELFDTTYVGNPHDLISQPSAFARLGPVQRTPITHVLVCKPKRSAPSLSEFLDVDAFDSTDNAVVIQGAYETHRPFVSGHNRLYHYSTTNLPMPPHAILHSTSEDEVAPSWLTSKICAMIDEFSDVNEGEKHFMKMWNLHVQRHTFVGDCQISLALSTFLESHGSRLIELGLYRNFVIHCCNLFEFGVISPMGVFNALTKMQRIIKDNHLQPLNNFGSIKEQWNARQKEKERKSEDVKSDKDVRRKDFSGIFAKSSAKSDKDNSKDEGGDSAGNRAGEGDVQEEAQMQDHSVSSSTQDEHDLPVSNHIMTSRQKKEDTNESDDVTKKGKGVKESKERGLEKSSSILSKGVTMIKITPPASL